MKSIKSIITEARAAGSKAAATKLSELQSAGPKWEVKDDFTGKSVGTMLDVCGFAHIIVKINGNDKRWQELRHFAAIDSNRVMVHSSYGFKTIAIFDMCRRQEMSVNEAANEAAAEVLRSYGFDCWMDSRID